MDYLRFRAPEKNRGLGDFSDALLVIGTALVDHIDELPDGKLKLAEILDAIVTDVPTRIYLAKLGHL